MPSNVKFQNVDFLKSDAYDWLERQFSNVLFATKEALEGLRVLGKSDGTLTMPAKYNQLLNVTEVIGTGNGATKGYYYITGFKPVKKSSATLTYTVGGTKYQTTDDGNGAFSQTGVLSGTINYTTGEISLTFTTAPDTDTYINLTYTTDVAGAYNTVKGKLAEVFVTLKQLVSNGDNLSDPF